MKIFVKTSGSQSRFETDTSRKHVGRVTGVPTCLGALILKHSQCIRILHFPFLSLSSHLPALRRFTGC